MTENQSKIYNVLETYAGKTKTAWQIAQETGILSQRQIRKEISNLCTAGGYPIVSICHDKPKGFFLCLDKNHPEAMRYKKRLKANIIANAMRLKAFDEVFKEKYEQANLFDDRETLQSETCKAKNL